MVGKMGLDLDLEAFEIPNALRESGSSLYYFFMHTHIFSYTYIYINLPSFRFLFLFFITPLEL
jgi:hypothetical protein